MVAANYAHLPRQSLPQITIITPTIGRPSLDVLIASVDSQHAEMAFHLLLWDDAREAKAKSPEAYNSANRLSLVLPGGFCRNHNAPGSPLRSVGLMAAATDWVTFADDDVRWDAGHLAALLTAVKRKKWASTLRTAWSPSGERLGVDRFESVGDDPGRRVSPRTSLRCGWMKPSWRTMGNMSCV